MYYPHFEDVLRMSSSYNMIPISYSFLADVETPISVFQKLRRTNSFLLESVEGGTKWARYSFIGIDPFIHFSGKHNFVQIIDRSGTVTKREGNPLDELRKELKKYSSPQLDTLPRFSGGAVGYLGFDIVRYYESHLQPHSQNDLDMDDIRFLFTDSVIAFDHLRQEIHVMKNLHVEEGDSEFTLQTKYKEVTNEIKKLVTEIKKVSKAHSFVVPSLVDESEEKLFESNLTKKEFTEMVEQAKEYIANGDVFQVVLSQRFQTETDIDPFVVYRVLRSMNPSPYMFYVQYDDEVLVGTSPEMLVRVENKVVEVRPIAGTRPRGQDSKEDQNLADDLLKDEKERAEHHMLVDLGRNDVGRVSQFGTVMVDQLMEVEYYSHVIHLVSQVRGKLKEELDPFDALLSCFPAGTVSGAPKIRALEIIHELENVARNAYAGAIGYFSFNGNMDSCITIRTIIFKEGSAYVQAGAGIVADSVPENEYEETRNKARALIKAIQSAEKAFKAEEVEDYV